MVPSTYEDGTLYNVLPSGNKAPDETGNHNGYDQTRADFTFSRGSNLAATRVNADGLIEKGRENLVLQSNQFDTTWTNIRSSESSGESGYDGTNDAWKFKDSTDSGTHRLDQVITLTNSAVYSFSIYAKEGEHDTLGVEIGNTSLATNYVLFDLSNGTTSETGSIIDSSMTDVGNGWYRCSMTALAGSSDRLCMQVQTGSTASYTGNGTDGILIQDAQLEAGLVATAYMDSGSTTAQAGILEDMPRINYDANGENGALLLEPSRTNLFIQSEPAFKNTHPAIVGQYLTGDNFNIGVYGGVQLNGGNTHYYYGASTSASTTYAVSFFIRRTDGGVPTMAPSSSSSNGDFMLVAYGSGFGSGDMDSYSITLFKNDVYKFEGVLTTTPSGSASNNGIIKYSANSSNDIQITGIQFEAGSHVSSYIPTHGAAVTRGADDAEADNISDLIGQTEGTFLIDAEVIAHNGDWIGIYPSSGSAYQNGFLVGYFSGAIRAQLYAGGTAYVYTKSTTNEKRYKIAITYTSSSYKVFIDGVKVHDVSKSTSFAVSLDRLAVTGTSLTGKKGNVKHKEILMFPTALTDAECVTLTTL